MNTTTTAGTATTCAGAAGGRKTPPFDHTELLQSARLPITNVVFPAGEGFSLKHDFLAKREAVVEQFTVDLEIDPAWQARRLQRHQTAGPLPLAVGYVVNLDLAWQGAGEAPVHRAKRPFLPLLLILLGIAGAMAYLVRGFIARQGACSAVSGRRPGCRPAAEQWLEQYLLPLRAEGGRRAGIGRSVRPRWPP